MRVALASVGRREAGLMDRPYACAFCGAALDPSKADALMGMLDCAACGKLAQLDTAAVAALARKTPITATLLLKAPECQACGKPLTRAMVAAGYGIARCECGVVNDLTSQYRAAKAQLVRRDPTKNDQLSLRRPNPGHFLVRELPGALDISWKDSEPVGWGLLPLFVLAPLVMVSAGFVQSLSFWFGAFAFAASSILYGIAVSFIGRLHITASKTELKVHRSPFPWPTRTIRREQLVQLFVLESRRDDGSGGYTDRAWRLAARLKGKKQLSLTPACDDPSMPRFLEQQLERYLGIKDRPVEGEAPKE